MFQILVVDDDKNTRRLLRAVLEQNGYTVITAANGEDAMDQLAQHAVDENSTTFTVVLPA